MINEIVDLFGKSLQVGDKIVWGKATSSYNCCVYSGEIVGIETKPLQTYIKVRIDKCGDNHRWYLNRIRTFIYPRKYNNIMKL